MTNAVREVVLTTCPRDCYDACGIAVVKRGRRDPPRARRPGPSGQPRQALPQVLDRLQRRLPRSGGAADPAAAPRRGRRARAGSSRSPGTTALGGDRRAPRRDRRDAGPARDPQRPLHRHALAARLRLPAAVLQPARGDRGRPGHGLQQGRPRRARLRLRHLRWIGFDPRTARDAACIVVWGANPSASAPHAHEHWLPEAPAHGHRRRPDPDRRRPSAPTSTSSRSPAATRRSRSRCCTSSCRDGLADRDFLARHTVGWEELEPLLDALHARLGRGDDRRAGGADRGGGARSTAAGPSLLWLGQGLQRQRTGGNVDARLRAAARRDRQPRQARRRASSTSTGRARAASTTTT